MSFRKPSEVLSSLSSTLPLESFANLIQKYLCPGLDNLSEPERLHIFKVLESAEKAQSEISKRIEAIDYERQGARLEKQLRALQKHVERNWRKGYDEQADMMVKIATDIALWLNTLATLGVEDSAEIQLVHRCIKLCKTIIDDVYDCGSRADFGNLDYEEDIVFKDSNDRILYNCPGSYRCMAWLWRELMLTALVKNKATEQVTSMIKDLEQMGFLDRIETQLRMNENETETLEGYPFFDEHWSTEARHAATEIKSIIQNRRISAFEKQPTFVVFNSLIAGAPELEEALVETARKHFFRREKTISWNSATKIFIHAHANADVMKVIDELDTTNSPPYEATQAMRAAVSHLVHQGDEYRTSMRVHVEYGISISQTAMWNLLESLYPNLEEAFDYLEEKITSKKLSKRVRRGSGYQIIDRQRENILIKFRSIARRGGPGDPDYDSEEYGGYENDEVGYNRSRHEGSDYKFPKIAEALDKWLEILNKWPNETEAKDIRAKLKATNLKHPLFFSVDGISEILASKSHWERIHPREYDSIAGAIHAVYDVFGPDRPDKPAHRRL